MAINFNRSDFLEALFGPVTKETRFFILEAVAKLSFCVKRAISRVI